MATAQKQVKPSESYETAVTRRQAQLKAKGIPDSQARMMALKWASRRFGQQNPGDKASNTRGGKQGSAYKRLNNSATRVYDYIMELHGITGLIGSPPMSTDTGVTSGSNAATTLSASSPASRSHTKANQRNPGEEPETTSSATLVTDTKVLGGLNPKNPPKVSVDRETKMVAKHPPTRATLEAIEAEFGII